jgi:cytochrome c oxidase assembly protein subunit 15
VLALVGLMVLTGGLVAGLKAGLAFNTWPLMNGALVPPMMLQFDPWWWNAFENVTTVQFNHRMAAYALVAAVAMLWWTVRREPSTPARARAGVHWLAGGVVVQAALGIATLLFMVPVAVASLHQAGALVVFALALNVAHALR